MWRCSITRRQATYDILRGKGASNHVHIYVSVQPDQSISKVVQSLNETSSRKIQQEFPELRNQYWGKHLWAVGYFVRTVGNVTDQMIKDYIDKHESRDDKFGNFQVEN
ncbi:MAG: IS200/IS605 family transposase [Rickettsia endosymbiont of Ixodes persulcatus]|nr:IS200/IS605 family transposase [Rickettsia endosymbiont of Ixodes persulcatus]